MRRINLVSLVIAAMAIASLFGKMKGGYGFLDGR